MPHILYMQQATNFHLLSGQHDCRRTSAFLTVRPRNGDDLPREVGKAIQQDKWCVILTPPARFLWILT